MGPSKTIYAQIPIDISLLQTFLQACVYQAGLAASVVGITYVDGGDRYSWSGFYTSHGPLLIDI